ncbi:hypothetical protein [Mucilaginibacter myungsuensis]|uniref:Uncharacterized protein n=1 Tax=Mucilaginibacter myungsuensis TaxID=649104 RepID=A0A929PWY1_9SPHI|nr:hypothetical protein [Mucilaginibacter myungsuensis]MBE9661820.1 hypothetical protein [Mucilaginibacter myungsuensis]MDN3599746.1 hypothetical protein [Mucilaginibacter myungsuensis]
MKYLYFIILLFNIPGLKAQTVTNNFRIVDADTKRPIPYASVSLPRASLAMNTEADGLLSIPGDLSKMNDVLVITAQNYTPSVSPLNKLSGMDTIQLKKYPYRPVNIPVSSTGKDSVLNKFTWQDVTYFAGVHSQHARFEYLQIAQQFDSPAPGAKLSQIFFRRFATWGTYTERTRFRLRFYDIDPVYGTPGKDLCHEIIEETNKDDPRLTVNLQKYNIIIPGKKFFVAIEWLRTFENAGYAPNRAERNLVYKPTIGILPYKTDKLNIWVLNYAHQWKPFTYFSPYYTDLALSATVKW